VHLVGYLKRNVKKILQSGFKLSLLSSFFGKSGFNTLRGTKAVTCT